MGKKTGKDEIEKKKKKRQKKERRKVLHTATETWAEELAEETGLTALLTPSLKVFSKFSASDLEVKFKP